MFSFKNNTSGFTLVELLIAMTIFGMMTIMVMEIYISTTNMSRKLDTERELAETAREITERISADIHEKWISDATIVEPSYFAWKNYNYTDSGSEYLVLKNGIYIYGVKTLAGLKPCLDPDKSNPKIHCGLYFVEGNKFVDAYNLVDSFNPDESKKRVKIEDLKFYVSGDGISSARKVVIVFDIGLMAKNGLSARFAGSTKLHIQTTLSERSWKK